MKNRVTELYDYNWGYKATRVLNVATKLNIFTLLCEKAMTSEELSKQCRTKPHMTEKLLIACAAMGLVEKDGGRYRNSELSQTYLVQGGQLYQGDIVIHSGSIWGFWERLEDEISIEPIPKDDKETEHKRFIKAMHQSAISGATQTFTDNIDLTGRKKLVDVGGGAGSFAIAACRRYPGLRAVVFDLRKTLSIAKETIEQAGMADRVTLQAGDWEIDGFGSDNDVALFSHVLFGHESKGDMKLKKAYDSMVPGALLVVQDFMLNDEKAGPLIPALFNMMRGSYSVAEMKSTITDAGFIEPKVVVPCYELGCTWITAEKPAGG